MAIITGPEESERSFSQKEANRAIETSFLARWYRHDEDHRVDFICLLFPFPPLRKAGFALQKGYNLFVR